MRTKPMVYASRLRRGEWAVIKPEPHRGLIWGPTWAEARDKALAWVAREAKRMEKAKRRDE